VQAPVVVISTYVKKNLGRTCHSKPIPLFILEIGVGAEVTLINNITHAFEVFRTQDTTLKDICCGGTKTSIGSFD
jgi:hypothetical protein